MSCVETNASQLMLSEMVSLRRVELDDLLLFFEHQSEPEANAMAAFPARDHDTFMSHWQKILADETVIVRSVLVGDDVGGNIVSWKSNSASVRVLGKCGFAVDLKESDSLCTTSDGVEECVYRLASG